MMELLMGGLYGLWLLAGFTDFALHRRTDLPHTSGLRESSLHGVQLLLIGGATLAWLLLRANAALVIGLALVALAHAAAGYLDTVSADGRRRISPVEQHVHSVLDVAPWLFLVWIASRAVPGWGPQWEPASPGVMAAVVLPALLVAVVPWLFELSGCLRASRK